MPKSQILDDIVYFRIKEIHHINTMFEHSDIFKYHKYCKICTDFFAKLLKLQHDMSCATACVIYVLWEDEIEIAEMRV